MATHEMVEQILTKKIEEDLRKEDDFANDPLGYALYLFFLLKNGIRSPEAENLTDWMNVWIDDVINHRNLTRFVDRDFSSATFAYYCLKKFGRLRAKIELDNLKQLSSLYAENNIFFNSFTFSAIILLATFDVKENVANYSDVMKRIEREVDQETVFNDAKNLIFASMLFEETGSDKFLRKTNDFCWRKLLDNNIPICDELFFAWVLWKFRKLREAKDVQRIREFTDTTLSNAAKSLPEESVDESIREIYGWDSKRNGSASALSKIALGVFLDILRDFVQRTVRVTKEELARKDIPLWIRSASLIASILIGINVLIIWVGFSQGLIKKVVVDSPFAIPQYAINVSIFLTIASLTVVSISLLWDIIIKGYTDPALVKKDLVERLKNRAVDVLVIAFGVIAAFFGL